MNRIRLLPLDPARRRPGSSRELRRTLRRHSGSAPSAAVYPNTSSAVRLMNTFLATITRPSPCRGRRTPSLSVADPSSTGEKASGIVHERIGSRKAPPAQSNCRTVCPMSMSGREGRIVRLAPSRRRWMVYPMSMSGRPCPGRRHPYPCLPEPPGQTPIPLPGPRKNAKNAAPRPASRARPPPPPPEIRTRPVSTRQGRVRKMNPASVCGPGGPEGALASSLSGIGATRSIPL